jgi:uncharacterized membrane protein
VVLIAFASFVIAIVALVRSSQLERELTALRRRLDATDVRLWRQAGDSDHAASPHPAPSAPHSSGPPATAAPAEAAAAVAAVPAMPPSPAALPEHSPHEPPIAARESSRDWLRAPGGSPASRTTDPAITERAGIGVRLERQIGERLLLYAGMVLVVLAAGFFLRFAFEREWLSPTVRVALGILAGVGFVAGGHRLAQRGYEQYGLFLCGGGFALLFLSTYAAFAIYGLIGQLPAFASLVVIAAGAAVVADHHGSQPMAFMAVCGGFSAPFLVSTGSDAQIALFTYDAVLIAATMYLARRRTWPALNVASFVLTCLSVGAWIADRYTASRYLSTELFLTLFCAMFVAILREQLRTLTSRSRVAVVCLSFAPVLYHLASVVILFDHGLAFLLYITLMSVTLVLASLETGAAALRFAGWLALIVPLGFWVDDHQSRGWLVGSLVVAVGTWGIVLAPAMRSAARREGLDAWDLRLIHSAGLAAFGLVYLALVELFPTPVLAAAAWLSAAANGAVWASFRNRSKAAVHWLGVASALAAVAIAIGFEGYWVVVMWSAEAAALMWVGTQTARVGFRIGGLYLFGIAVVIWFAEPRATGPFQVLLNARALSGACIIAALYVVAAIQKRLPPAGPLPERSVVLVAAHALTVVLISLEIDSYWTTHTPATLDADLVEQLMLSSWWAAYAGALIAVGMRRHMPVIRYFAIVLFALTAIKVLAIDTQALEGIYRVLVFLVVGAIMLGASFLYQRTRGSAAGSE